MMAVSLLSLLLVGMTIPVFIPGVLPIEMSGVMLSLWASLIEDLVLIG